VTFKFLFSAEMSGQVNVDGVELHWRVRGNSSAVLL